VSLMDEGLDVLKLCFQGERFSYQGKRYQLDDVVITPGYVQVGGPPMWVAAMSEAGARRAARLDCNFLPQGNRQASFETWREVLRDSSRRPEDYRVGIIRGVLVTDDRDADWPLVRAAEQYRMQLYSRFFEESGEGLGGPGEAVPQRWIVGSVDHCVAELVAFVQEFGVTDLVTWAAPPGMQPAQMNGSLERLFRDVVPKVRDALGR